MRLRITRSEDPESPRDWDNVGTMVCGHRDYQLGDIQLSEGALEIPEGSVVLPLYLLDHSGLAMRTSDFSDCDPGSWDSGQVGVIYCSPETMEQERISAEIARQNMVAEVETYDLYLQNRVYGFVLEGDEPEPCPHCGHVGEREVLDSCGGFYGEDWESNGMAEHLPEEALPLLKNAEIE